MGSEPDFTEYDERMRDPEYRKRMERRTPLSEDEEQEMYELMDALANAQIDGVDADGDITSE